MGRMHDKAARLIAKKFRCQYNPAKSPDVRCTKIRVEVKSKASEIPKALKQLGGGPGLVYIALPNSEIPRAKQRLKGLKTGLMNHNGTVKKASTRKRR